MARQKKPATPRPKKPTPAMIAVAGTVWQEFLASLGVAVKWIDDAQELAELAQELAELARQGETVAIDFETTGDFVAGGIRPRLVQLFAGGDEVAVADLELTGFAPIACLADVGCVAYGAGFEARVFMGQELEPRLNDAALAAGLRLDRDAFQRDLATTWRRIKRKPTPTNKKAMQRSDFSGELTPEQIAYAALGCDHGLPGVGGVSDRGAVPALRDRQGRDPGRGIDGDGRPGIRPRRACRHRGRMESPGGERGAPLQRD